MLRRIRKQSAPDPFVILSVQERLARVACKIRDLEQGDVIWAKGHHLKAAEIAYDDLLAEACGLAGIPIPQASRPVRRLIMEADLHGCGWTW
jgi:hypothetical protein